MEILEEDSIIVENLQLLFKTNVQSLKMELGELQTRLILPGQNNLRKKSMRLLRLCKYACGLVVDLPLFEVPKPLTQVESEIKGKNTGNLNQERMVAWSAAPRGHQMLDLGRPLEDLQSAIGVKVCDWPNTKYCELPQADALAHSCACRQLWYQQGCRVEPGKHLAQLANSSCLIQR